MGEGDAVVIPVLCSSELVNTVVHAKIQFAFSKIISVFSEGPLHSILTFSIEFHPLSVGSDVHEPQVSACRAHMLGYIDYRFNSFGARYRGRI